MSATARYGVGTAVMIVGIGALALGFVIWSMYLVFGGVLLLGLGGLIRPTMNQSSGSNAKPK